MRRIIYPQVPCSFLVLDFLICQAFSVVVTEIGLTKINDLGFRSRTISTLNNNVAKLEIVVNASVAQYFSSDVLLLLGLAAIDKKFARWRYRQSRLSHA